MITGLSINNWWSNITILCFNKKRGSWTPYGNKLIYTVPIRENCMKKNLKEAFQSCFMPVVLYWVGVMGHKCPTDKTDEDPQ